MIDKPPEGGFLCNQKRREVKEMKKVIVILFAMLAVYSLMKFTKPAVAAKTIDSCAYIKDGTIKDKFNNTIGLGYNSLGYNYEAHIFNGMYCDAYANADWCQQFKDVKLQMKWNDAWLSNKDCGTQGSDQLAFSSSTIPDHTLDRHYPSSSYIGSGAWLTNHATGTYTSSKTFDWDVTGSWVMNVEYSGVIYPEDLVLVQSGINITGTSLALVGGGSPWTIDSGSVVGNTINFFGYYNSSPTMRIHVTGTIADDGSMNGTWSDEAPGTRTGTWSTSSGSAKKIYASCTVSDFVKIIAAPTGATLDGGNWIAADGTVIGPEIWGSFAIIQEIASDPCEEYGVINYMSPLRKGLGKW